MRRPGPPLFASHAELWESTGRFEMSVFHALSAGKTGHPAMAGPAFGGTAAVGGRVVVVGIGAVEPVRPTVVVVGRDVTAVVEVELGGSVDDVLDVEGMLSPGAGATVASWWAGDADGRPELHEATVNDAATTANADAHRFDLFDIAVLVPDPGVIIGGNSPAIEVGPDCPSASVHFGRSSGTLAG